MRLLQDITTDEYGTAYDLVSIMAFVGFVLGLGLYTIGCFTPAIKFSLLEYAGGFSSMIAATSAAMRIKPAARPPE